MAEYTLSQLRALIDATCYPPSATDNQKNTLINKVREEFYFTTEEGGSNALWKGVIVEQSIPVITQFADANGNSAQTVTLPRTLATLLKARDEDGTIGVRNEWVQFDKYGWGARLLGDLGDGFCGITDINASGATMKVTTTGAEAGSLTMTFTGTDADGNAISETVNIPTVTGSVSTSATFYSISEVVKSVTAYPVVVNQTTAAVDTLFARYAPSETFPSYRRYIYAFHTNRTSVCAKCKRQYLVLTADNDAVEFGSVRAFENGLQAYRWFQNNDKASYRQGIMDAIGLLNGEQAAYEGETAEGVVQMEYITSPGRICNIL